MNTLSCQPVIFGPHITPHCPAVPWWHVTAVRLGWWIVALIVTAVILSAISEWIRDRWEIGCGHRITRRWYGTHARVCLRAEAADWGPARYTVIGWDSEHTGIPWLLVHKLNPADLRYWAEDAEAFYALATDFVPDSVRRFRPHWIRCVVAGRVVMLPWLVKWLPLPVHLPEGVAR